MTLPISLELLAVFIIVNFIGLSSIGFTFYIMQRKHETKSQKIKASIGLGLSSLILLLVIFADIGIYFWLKSGDYRATLVVMPLALCVAPVFFLIVSVGAYLQLVYRDKIESLVNSVSEKNRTI